MEEIVALLRGDAEAEGEKGDKGELGRSKRNYIGKI